MENSFLHHLKRWDDRMNGLPRKALLIALTLTGAAVLFFVLPYIWPFLLALGFSLLLEPLVGRLQRGIGSVKLSRPLGAVLGMLLLFGVAGAAAAALLNRLVQEAAGLVRNMPELVNWFGEVVFPYIRTLYDEYRLLLPAYLYDLIQSALTALGQSLLKAAGALSAALTSGAFSTAMSIPNVLLSIHAFRQLSEAKQKTTRYAGGRQKVIKKNTFQLQ